MDINILLVGDKYVGKTSFIRRLITNNFERNYIHTDERIIYPFIIQNNFDRTNINIYDGCIIDNNNTDNAPTNIDGAIIFFSINNEDSMNNVVNHYNNIISLFGKIPCIVCALKSDITKNIISKQKIQQITYNLYQNYGLSIVTVSNKIQYISDYSNYYILQSLLYKIMPEINLP